MLIEVTTTGIHNEVTGDDTPRRQHIFFSSSKIKKVEIDEKSTKIFIDFIEDLVNFDNLLDRKVWRNSHPEKGYIEILHMVKDLDKEYQARVSITQFL